MEAELQEIRKHLERHPPFVELPPERLNEIAAAVEVSYFRAGTVIVSIGDAIDALHYIRSGSVEIRRRGGEMFNCLAEGDVFGQLALISGKTARFSVRAREDTLIYLVPAPVFRALTDEFDAFAEYLEVEDRTRLRQTVSYGAGTGEFMTVRVDRMIHREPAVIDASTAIRDAAARMEALGISSLVIVSDQRPDDPAEGIAAPDGRTVVGIVTDGDLVARALARGRSSDEPVANVMTADPVLARSDNFLFEALLSMLRHNVHHLPVVAKNRLVGVVDLTDVVSLETRNSLFVVRNIFARNSVEELEELKRDVAASFVRMVNEDANSRMIGSAMAAIGRSFKQRLLELGHQRFGPPPVPYCLLALGSMARDEQFLNSDQDNAMVLHDDYDEAAHGEYFRNLAQFVCDGLARVGYRYCKGGFMASNNRWRQPLAAWKRDFIHWIEQPRPEALLNSSVFFDLEGVAGDTRMADELKALLSQQASQSRRFLGCLAINSQRRTPPLGFFRDFVLEKSGRHTNTINLKRRGSAPLVDVIRVHALASASRAQNSFERLEDVVGAGFLTGGMADDLRDGLEFISIVRARHQAFDIENGKVPDNNLNPETLSRLDRRSLKDAFTVLSNAQKFIKFRYRT